MVKPSKLLLILLQCTRIICAMDLDDEKMFEAAEGFGISHRQSLHNGWTLDDISGHPHLDSTLPYDHQVIHRLNSKKVQRPTFPLLPYYFVAGLESESMCPLNKLVHNLYQDDGNGSISKFTPLQVVRRSDFANIPSEDPLPYGRVVMPSAPYLPLHLPSISYEGFASRLSRMNLIFLAALNEYHLDENVTNELIKTLNWLKSILDAHSNSYSHAGSEEAELRSKTAQLVRDHLQAPETQGPCRTIVLRGKTSRVKVSHFSAKDTRIMLTILANYYMSTNKTKWESLFDGSLEFLKYYMRIAQYQYSSTAYRQSIQRGLLPWNQPAGSFQVEQTMFHDFNTMHKMMSKYVCAADEEVRNLDLYDTEHSKIIKKRKQGHQELLSQLIDNSKYDF